MPRSAPVPRLDRRRARTRSAIMDAGQALFAARALEAVTIDEIVDAANVAKGSFYNHFDGKEQLASAIVALVQGDSEFHIFAANRAITDPAARMARALCVMIAYAAAHPDRLQAMISLAARRTGTDAPLNAGLVGDLRDGLAQGRFAGVSVEAGLLIVIGIVHLTVATAVADRAALRLSAPTASLAAMVGAGLLRALGVNAVEATGLAQAAADELLGETRS